LGSKKIAENDFSRPYDQISRWIGVDFLFLAVTLRKSGQS